jgi:hypothetical protein
MAEKPVGGRKLNIKKKKKTKYEKRKIMHK